MLIWRKSLVQKPNPFTDLSDNERDSSAQAPSSQVPNSDSHQQAINYTSLAATAAAVAASGVKSNVTEQEQQSISSTETLLRNIQSLLTVAADNARQQERQITYEKGTIKSTLLSLYKREKSATH